MNMDENVENFEIDAKDAEYFHKDFHSSLNMGLEYLGSNYGKEHLFFYLSRLAKNYYLKLIDVTANPLNELEKLIKNTYAKEKALDAISLERDDKSLTITVNYCPAVKHLKETKREVSKYFGYSTEYVMQTLASELGLEFTLEYYTQENGASRYRFSAK